MGNYNRLQLYHRRRSSGWRCRLGCLKSLLIKKMHFKSIKKLLQSMKKSILELDDSKQLSILASSDEFAL